MSRTSKGKLGTGLGRWCVPVCAALCAVLALTYVISCSRGAGNQQESRKRTIAGVKKLAIRDAKSGNQTSKTVAFTGTVTVVDNLFGYLIVQDETAGIRVNPAIVPELSLVGRLVQVRGQIAGDDQSGSVSAATVQDIGPGGAPRALALSQFNSPDNQTDGLLVSIRGIVTATQVDGLGRLTIDLKPLDPKILAASGHGKPLRATVMDDTRGQQSQLVDSDVIVTGVLSATTDVEGAFTGFSLLVPALTAVQIVTPANDPSALPLRHLAELESHPSGYLLHRVRIQGQLRKAASGTDLELLDGTAALPIEADATVDLSAMHNVDAVAFLSSLDGKLVLEHLRVITSDLHDGPGLSVTIPVLRNAAAIRSLPMRLAALALPVDLDGVITFADLDNSAAFFQDSTDGIYVSLHGLASRYLEKETKLRAGMHVRIRGVTGPGDFAPIVNYPSFEILNNGRLPAPAKLDLEDIFQGNADSQWVELEGTVQNISLQSGRAIATLAWGPHRFQIRFGKGITIPQEWLDRHVRVRGACGTLFNQKRQLIGIQLFVPDLNEVTDQDASSAPPAGSTVVPIGNLLQFEPNETPGHRVYIRGTVTVQHPAGPTWIQDETGGILITDHNPVVLVPGQMVEAAGFASPGSFSPILHDAYIHVLEERRDLKPVHATAEDLLTGSSDAKLVEIDGRLFNQYRTDKEQILQLRAGKGNFLVRATAILPHFENGAVLRVVGVCSVSGEVVRALMVPESFEIIVGSPGDVTVLRPAPWLTGDRLLRFFALAVLAIAVVLAWASVLRRRVHQQTKLISQKLREVEQLKKPPSPRVGPRASSWPT